MSSHIGGAGLFKSSCVSKQGREIELLGIIHTATASFQGKKKKKNPALIFAL